MRAALLLLPVSLLAVAACDDTSGYSGAGYTPPPAAQSVTMGTIIDMQTVAVRNDNSDEKVAGAVVGGLVGGLIGNKFGKGSGNALMTGAGAVGGAVAGSKLAENNTPAVRYVPQWTVRLTNGRTISLIQDDGRLRVGQRVQVIESANGYRLEP